MAADSLMREIDRLIQRNVGSLNARRSGDEQYVSRTTLELLGKDLTTFPQGDRLNKLGSAACQYVGVEPSSRRFNSEETGNNRAITEAANYFAHRLLQELPRTGNLIFNAFVLVAPHAGYINDIDKQAELNAAWSSVSPHVQDEFILFGRAAQEYFQKHDPLNQPILAPNFTDKNY